MTSQTVRTLTAATTRPLSRRPEAHPDPERLVVAAVRAYLEVEAGRRPLEQLRAALSPTVLGRLRASLAGRRREARRAGRRTATPGPTLRSVRATHVSRPSDDVLEAAVVVQVGERSSAVCIRLEAWRDGWRVTELVRPDDGLDPLPSRPPFRPARDTRTADGVGQDGTVIDLTEGADTERSAADAADRSAASPAVTR